MTSVPKLSRYARRVLELAADDPQLQELMPDEAVLAAVTSDGQSLDAIVTAILSGYGARPALGERVYEVVTDPATGRRIRQLRPSFATTSYAELATRAAAVAAAWRRRDAPGVAPGEFVCFLGFAGIDYVTVDLACVRVGAVAVPLQTSLSPADLERIVGDTAPVVIAATVADLVVAAGLAGRHPSVRTLVVLDHDGGVDDDREQWAAAAGELARSGSAAQLSTVADLVARGAAAPDHAAAPPENPDRIALLIHSSGSTGTPKGAIITERHACFQFTSMPPTPVPTVRLCFAPLNHFMGRGAVFNTLARGGTAYFTASPDLATLFEDFRLVRPTEAVMFPRVFELIHRHFLGEVARRVAAGEVDVDGVREQVMDEMRYTFLGDRIASIFAGSAPTTPEIRRFVSACFPVTYAEGYGTTEAGGSVTVRDRINRSEVIDFRLRDVPELGYFSTDNPYPRGELCVKTRLAIPGYFKHPEATAALFDEDGFVRTGDIMELRGPDHLVYVDRRNDVLKLAHGEFVTLGAVGNVFETHSDVIGQIFVYGSSARAFVVAVVVPDPTVVQLRLGNPSDAEVKQLIRAELAAVAQANGLRTFEVPRDFLVENEPFSQRNGLLSSVSKRLRPRLLERYGERLEQLYDDLERKQHEELMALRLPAGGGGDVVTTIGKALAATLGLDRVDPAEERSFAELGGDSIGAATFAAELSAIFGVEVSANTILSPAGNLAAWARAVEQARRPDGGARPTARSVHGAPGAPLRASDLDLVRLLPGAVPSEVRPADSGGGSRVVLLTGAPGFLGRFLCLEWLERVAAVDGRMICLVRARDEDEARARLRAAFAGDDELARRFAAHEQRVEVLVGDLAEHRLGLDATTYDRLAEQVDRIVHVGALVNHVLPYDDLFGPNVLGTAELVALALAVRTKAFDFVSSMAVISYLEGDDLDEGSPLRSTVALRDHYSAHYGASKWAAEQVLRSAHERYGLPVKVFRGDMMLPHRRYQRQINTPDIFARLVFSVVATGLAPASFYETRPDGGRARAHYDGLPVDFIAAAVAAICADAGEQTGYETYHVMNPHDDGVSLDSIVDWIADTGRKIERVDDYTVWLQRFRVALEELPEEARSRSSLSVLESLRRPTRAQPRPIGSARFTAAVRHAAPEPEIPHLTQDFAVKCIDDLARLGLLPATPALSGGRAR